MLFADGLEVKCSSIGHTQIALVLKISRMSLLGLISVGIAVEYLFTIYELIGAWHTSRKFE